MYNEIVQLMTPEKNYASFRQALHTRQPPCIPYFGACVRVPGRRVLTVAQACT